MAEILAKYGTALVIDGIPLLDEDGEFISGLTFESGDIQVSKNHGTLANAATLVAETPSASKMYTIQLNSTEMQAARIVVDIIDQTDPKAWKDQRVIIHTYGHASAHIKVDLDDTVRLGLTALPNAAAAASGGLPTTTQWTDARAALLDKLNITGNVAGANDLASIQNNTRTTISIPMPMERPDSGNTRFKIYLNNYDTAGNMEEPDSAPTVAVVNQDGTSRSGNLQNPSTHSDSTTMVKISDGRYWIEYEMDSAHGIEALNFTFTVVEGTLTRYIDRATLVVDTTAVDFTSSDRSDLAAIKTKTDQLAFTANNVHSHIKAADEEPFEDIADAIDEVLTESHGAGSWQRGVTVIGTANNSSVPIRGDIRVGASVKWKIDLEAEGIDSTGWDEFVFVVKQDKNDADTDALVVIKVTSGGDASDGLLMLNRRLADDAADGSITVTDDAPNTLVEVTLHAEASQYIRAEEGQGYYWELLRYINDEPETIGDGRLIVERRLRRSAVVPG